MVLFVLMDWVHTRVSVQVDSQGYIVKLISTSAAQILVSMELSVMTLSVHSLANVHWVSVESLVRSMIMIALLGKCNNITI